MASKPVEAFLSKLKRVRRSGKGWEASCPVAENHKHGDRKPSLTVAEGEGGRVLVTCQKGTCDYEAICAAVGIEPVDLFPPDTKPERVVLESYPYVDAAGKTLFVVDRTYPKGFHQRRPTAGGWAYDLKGIKSRPLYRLPEVLEAVAAGKWILVAEGERDVHALEAQGLVATTNPGGSGKWREEHSRTLAGAKVRVIADADDVGRKHAAQVVAGLQGVAATVEAFEPTKGKDVREHLAAGGELGELAPMGTRPALEVLPGGKTDSFELVLGVRDGDAVIGEARLPEFEPLLVFEGWRPRRERTGVHSEVRLIVNGQIVAYSTINVSRHEDRTKLANLAAENLGDKAMGKSIRLRLDHFCAQLWDWWIAGDRSEWSQTTDIVPVDFLLYPYVMADAGTIVFGYKAQGKSWLGILWTMMLEHGIGTRWQVAKPRPTLFVNLERGRTSVDSRRAMVGRTIGTHGMRCLHAKGRSLVDVQETLKAEVTRHNIEAVVVDSLSRAGTGKLTADDDSNRSMDILNGLGCSWVVLAHTGKMDGEHVFGSVMHENAADVVVQLVGSPSALNPTTLGCRLKITAANDLPRIDPEMYALDFDAEGLTALRAPKQGEFPDLALDARSSTDQIAEAITAEGPLSVAGICESTGLGRSTVYEALKASRFIRTLSGSGRGNKSVYALRTLSSLEPDVSAGQEPD